MLSASFDDVELGNTLKLLAVGVASYALYHVALFFLKQYLSPLRALPGPPGGHLLLGHIKQVIALEEPYKLEEWHRKYGHVFRFRGLFNNYELLTTDPRAMHYVLNNSMKYVKPDLIRVNLERILGKGVLVAERQEHAKQRKVMNPAFAPAQIRDLTDIFVEKSNRLRDIWLELCAESSAPDGSIRLNALSWLSKMTLDVIGIAGFGYQFNALDVHDKPNELNEAFNKVFSTVQDPSVIDFIPVPFFGRLPTKRWRDAQEGMFAMNRIGMALVAEKKAAVLAAAGGEKENVVVSKGDRDLLSLLIKANMASDLPESQRLSDADVLAQVPTFLTAGHETSSTATMWALFGLTQAPHAQQKLRDELRAFAHDEPTMDELAAFPYLDAIVRETLRLYAPVPGSARVPLEDDEIPLERPFVDVHGVTQTSIRVRKGEMINIPALMIHRLEEFWGPDAKEFNPERWFDLPAKVKEIPNVWGNSLTFSAGQHACIGYRFALTEIKAILFALVRAFEFELAVPADQIGRKTVIVQRPFVKNEPDQGNQLPLIVRPYRPS